MSLSLALLASLVAGAPASAGPVPARQLDALVGRPADIAASAYTFRADRKPEENAPESWLALMRFAGLPLNRPLDIHDPSLRPVLCGLLWEEVRPLQRLELSWPAASKRRPAPEDVRITTLDSQSSSSSWWNNLKAVAKPVTASVSSDGMTYVYALGAQTCGVVVSLANNKDASDFDVPEVRALVAECWKKMELEIEWGFAEPAAAKDFSGRISAYDGRLDGLRALEGDTTTVTKDAESWRSTGKGAARRGLRLSLLYMGTSRWRAVQPFTSQPEDVARTIVSVWTAAGNVSFLAADLERGPILAPEYGFFVRRTTALATPPAPDATPAQIAAVFASQASSAREFVTQLQARKLATIRQQTRAHEEQTWEGAVSALNGANLPPQPKPPAGSEPVMQVLVPSERLTAQWNLGAWHLVRHAVPDDKGRLHFNDHPYGILGAETYMILAALDVMGAHKAAEDGLEQWLTAGQGADRAAAADDPPVGAFSEGKGCMSHAEGPDGFGGNMDVVHAFGPGSIGWAMTEHYRLTGDKQWLRAAAPRIQASAAWMLRQRRWLASLVPGGERLWCKGLEPALQVTPDSGGLWMQFYEAEAYYWSSVARFARALTEIDVDAGAKLAAEAEAWRKDVVAAVERSIALSPVVLVRDGTYHSVIPFACYVRGSATNAWGFGRDGSGEHVGPLYWDTVQSAAALVSPAGLLSPSDVRVQGYLDVLEDRLLLENPNLPRRTPGYEPERDWFAHAGWQYQGGLERTSNMHLAADDVPVFLRSFLNGYAIDIVPGSEYVFNEHATRGPEDKIFEEAAFLERFRMLLVMEDGPSLWLARATPRVWLEQGQRITVKHAPTHFGDVDYEIVSDVANGKITATIELPSRSAPKEVRLRLRHPKAAKLASVLVNGNEWKDFDAGKELVRLYDLAGTVRVEGHYAH
jgi:hypothetical protein